MVGSCMNALNLRTDAVGGIRFGVSTSSVHGCATRDPKKRIHLGSVRCCTTLVSPDAHADKNPLMLVHAGAALTVAASET